VSDSPSIGLDDRVRGYPEVSWLSALMSGEVR